MMIFRRVDFPAPFSPISPTTSPSNTSRSTPLRARVPANTFVILEALKSSFFSILFSSSILLRDDLVASGNSQCHGYQNDQSLNAGLDIWVHTHQKQTIIQNRNDQN